jgi:hypothetical protein
MGFNFYSGFLVGCNVGVCARYHTRPVPKSEFSVTLAVSATDENYNALVAPAVDQRPRSIYHRLDQYGLADLRADLKVCVGVVFFCFPKLSFMLRLHAHL